ncbi:MAG TPA: hypothetical protein P5110_03695 [Candidatus Omnitrophota bacterium]|nr:hypothetical protein [Candidatus Omnitrophota bacterium]HRZ14595.1 hypothetical protein [Candidatus Omnitrophota bacterium]
MGNMQAIFVEPTKTILDQIQLFLVDISLVLIILFIGWIISKFIKVAVAKFLKVAKIDKLSDKIELDKLLEKGGIRLHLSDMIAIIVYWLCLLITLVVALNAVNLPIAADLFNRVVVYIPNVIAGVFILVLGMFLATLLRNIVQTAATNAGLAQAKFLSKTVETVVIVFAVMITLEQLKIGERIIDLAVGIFLGSIGLAFALAVGFGCQDIAKKLVGDLIEKNKSQK